jgi:SAM-dependent methyltransferase
MTVTTDYNTISSEYKRAKQQPWRLHIEYYTLMRLIGSLDGKELLDLACGEGFYTRALKRNGAARAVGVDMSERMIALAREEEARNPLGVEYLVKDVKELAGSEKFDLVVAGYLLNYARNREELSAMCQVIARSLKPAGRFVTVNNDPRQQSAHFPATKKYGFIKLGTGKNVEGEPIIYRIFLDGSSFDITNYYLSVETHEAAFNAAGMHGLKWHPPQLSPEGESEYDQNYWSDFLVHPPITFLEISK